MASTHAPGAGSKTQNLDGMTREERLKFSHDHPLAYERMMQEKRRETDLNPFFSPEDERLKDLYGLDPRHTDTHKIEILYEDRGLSHEEIAELLDLRVEEVQASCEQIERDLMAAGGALTEEERRRQRGRLIRMQERTLRDLTAANSGSVKDTTTTRLIGSITQQLVKLRGLEMREKDEEGEGALAGAALLSEKIARLSISQLTDLRKRLAA